MFLKHAQTVLEREATSTQAARKEALQIMGWDLTPPTVKYNLMFKELNHASGGLHGSFCFVLFCSKQPPAPPDPLALGLRGQS